eukprot:g9965.t1
MSSMATKSKSSAIHWFRKGLRLHDNPALLEAINQCENIYPVFIIDPWFAREEFVGKRRYQFLLESLNDLDKSLRSCKSRLYVAKGKPEEVLPKLFDKWAISLLTFEKDTEPYARKRDSSIMSMAESKNITVKSFTSHTLFDPQHLLYLNQDKVPGTYKSFCSLVNGVKVSSPCDAPTVVPNKFYREEDMKKNHEFDVPTLIDMGYEKIEGAPTPFLGGETEGLKRLYRYIQNKKYIAEFEKPKTSPNSLSPSTTVLSPYLKFGCVSSRLFYKELMAVYREVSKHSQPPVSLLGQLYWREWFYLNGFGIPNFDKMVGNPICVQINWKENKEHLHAWENAQTGFPFIDAIMTQLRTEGWIHHLARHMVACFLTRGDLFISWEKGAKVFDRYLLDADWSLNNANWQWLSASAFFHQYFRVYGPVSFGKKTDKNGDYIRKHLPVLKHMPKKYIYDPWNAPIDVQRTAGCIIGKDYPYPIVDHKIVSKRNMGWMADAYRKRKEMKAGNDNSKEKKKALNTKKRSSSSNLDKYIIKKK